MRYSFDNISKFKGFDAGEIYLVMFHVDKTPPHLGLVKDNKYCSITIKGVEMDVDVDTIFNVIKRKRIPTLFVGLNMEGNFDLRSYYQKYSSIIDQNISCLAPIKDVISGELNLVLKEVHVIFDLLDKLKEKELLKKIAYFNLEDRLNKIGAFEMKKYGFEELNEYLDNLRIIRS